jgi:hypothetical protein
MKHVDELKTEVAPFKLELPAPFDIKPDHEVALPGNRKALIFREEGIKRDFDGEKDVHTKALGWRVIIVNREGLITRRCADFDQGRWYSSELNVLVYLKCVVASLSKTKRTQTNTTDYDDE